MARTRRRYSDEERANALAALAANGGNLKATATQLGIPLSTVALWASGSNTPAVAELCNKKKAELSEEAESIAYQLLGYAPQKMKKANLQQLMTSFGIAVDKMRLLREQPTSINSDGTLTDDERTARITRLLDAARARRTGQIPPTTTDLVPPAGTTDGSHGQPG